MNKKAKFNIVDLLVIVVLVIGIALVGVRMFGGNDSGADDTTLGTEDPLVTNADHFYVTFIADSVPAEVGDHLAKGLKAENNTQNMDLGTVYDFTIAESRNWAASETGEFVVSPKPGFIQVTVTCLLSGEQTNTGLKVGSFMLNVGHYMTIRCGNTEMYCYVADIQPVN